jgi:hypothetical protein
MFLYSSCLQKNKNELRRLSTAETVKHLKERKVNQFKFIYKDSIGNDLTPELSKKFNSGKMIREFYVNQSNEIIQVRLKEYSHEKVFHEILIRELLNDPFKNYEFIEINCEESETLLKQVLTQDQDVRKNESSTNDIIQTDASNQQIVNSILKKCSWPNDPELINSIWFIIQHSESEFMAFYYLDFLKLVEKDLLKESTMAKMKDRMLMNNGYPQIYGTQIVGKNVYKLRDPKNVNQLRAEVGLGTIEENTKKFGFEFNNDDYIDE